MKGALAAGGAIALLLVAGSAGALEHQHHLGLDPSLSMLKVDDKSSMSVGGGLGAHYTYDVDDQFLFLAEVNYSRVAADQQQDFPESPHTRPADVAYAMTGVGYVIDVMRFVPYLGALIGGYRLSGGTLDGPLIIPGAEAAVGLDYQITPHFTAGVGGRQHFLLTRLSTYPTYTTVLLRVEYVWGGR